MLQQAMCLSDAIPVPSSRAWKARNCGNIEWLCLKISFVTLSNAVNLIMQTLFHIQWRHAWVLLIQILTLSERICSSSLHQVSTRHMLCGSFICWKYGIFGQSFGLRIADDILVYICVLQCVGSFVGKPRNTSCPTPNCAPTVTDAPFTYHIFHIHILY